MRSKTNRDKINLADLNLDNFPINELENLIAEAKKSIKRQQRRQVREVRKQIEQLAGGVGMTAAEVMSYNRRKPFDRPAGQPKYRNPEPPHQTWTGHGKRPQWFIDAEKKYSREEMEIKD